MKSLILFVQVTLLASLSLAASAADYRIPSSARVTAQSVELNLDPREAGYNGTTDISLEVSETTSSLSLHWIGLTVSDITLSNDTTSRTLTSTAGEWDMHQLGDGEPIAAGQYTLHLEFTGDYSTDALGLYKVTEKGEDYLFTQFEMMLARRVFPLVDEPDSKIPWSVTLSAPSEFTVAANTPVMETSEQAGWTRRVFKTTPPMSSYLLAIAVGAFDSTPIPNLSIPGVIYSPKGTADAIGYSAEVTAGILAGLEDYFGSPYPYEKLDFVAVPNFTFGAMENPGLVTYRTELLLNGDSPSPSSALSTVYVIAHELAHQWYGNLVTMAWWDDLWLNEAFASWMGYKVTHELHPEFRSDLNLPKSSAFPSDALGATKPIRRVVRTEEEVADGLGLNYSKGHAILNMLEQAIGEEAFKAGIRRYMKDHAWGNTRATDLWTALDAHADFSVGEVAETFLGQAGYPLITIHPDGMVSQTRFENVGAGLPAQTWKVPLSAKVADGDGIETLAVTLSAAEQTVDAFSGADWILPTAGGNGYFTWYTGESAYGALLENLFKLTDREKLSVLVNGGRLLTAGVVDMGQHMSLVQAMIEQPNEQLVLDAIEEVRMVAEMYRGTELEPAMRGWVTTLFEPWFKQLGAAPRANDSQAQVRLRARVLRVLAQLGTSGDVRDQLSSLADRYLEDPSSVESTIGLEALRMNAMFNGDAATATEYLGVYGSTDNATLKSNLQSAMYFTDEAAIEKVLSALAAGEVKSGDMLWMMSGLFYANPKQDVIYKHYSKHFDGIVERLPEFNVPAIPEITSAECDAGNLERQREFYENKGETFVTSLSKAQESETNCLNNKQRGEAAVRRFLEGP